MEHLHAYVHEDTAAALRAHAAANDRSLAGELRRALRLYVAMIERRDAELDARSIESATAGGDAVSGGGPLPSSFGVRPTTKGEP